MSPADLTAVSSAVASIERASALAALVRWGISHDEPPDEEARGGFYVVACEVELAAEKARKALAEILR